SRVRAMRTGPPCSVRAVSPGAEARRGYRRCGRRASSTASHVRGLLSLGSRDHVELDAIALGQRLEAVARDRREMDEHILARVGLDESEALRFVDPFDRAADATLARPGHRRGPRRSTATGTSAAVAATVAAAMPATVTAALRGLEAIPAE